MKKLVATGLIATLLAGCGGDLYVNSSTVVTTRPSYIQEIFPRGENVFACSNVGDLQYYLDNNIVQTGCGYVSMTAVTERGTYDSYRHGRVTIYQFQHGWYMYFTWYEPYQRRYYY